MSREVREGGARHQIHAFSEGKIAKKGATGWYVGGSKHPTPNYLYFRPLQKSILLKGLSDLLSYERSYTC